MSQTPKKQNFLHGAALLAMATAIVKVIGALYKIPLKMIIGDTGYGYFNTAYDIYSVLLMVSTAGLPIAMSRMISQVSALRRYNQVRRVYQTARTIFLILGILSCALMMIFCRELAAFQGQPDAWATIACLAPGSLLICLMSAFRGFFQGQGDMRPTSNSQILEAAVKLVVGLAAAYALMLMTQSVALAAAGAILGVTISCVASTMFLYLKFRPAYATLPDTGDIPDSYPETVKHLLAIAVPITVGSAGLQLLSVLQTSLYMSQLRAGLDASLSAAELEHLLLAYGHTGEMLSRADAIQFIMDNRKGIYNMASTISNMPNAFIVPITVSVLPAITSHLTLKNHAAVKATEESAARITGLITLPCSVGLLVLARPVMGLLGGYSGEKLELASMLMAMLAIVIFLYCVSQLMASILQAHGYAHLPVLNMLLAGVISLAVVYILSGNPDIGILGVPMGTILCYIVICILNIFCLYRTMQDRPALLTNLLRSAVPAAIMGIAVFGCYWAMENLLHITSNLFLCALPILVGVAVYAVCAVAFKSITREDCLLLPKGETIAKLLRL